MKLQLIATLVEEKNITNEIKQSSLKNLFEEYTLVAKGI